MNNLTQILIIKLGAMGDVLRTTPILRELNGEITWVTLKESLPLLINNPYIKNVITPDQCREIVGLNFDLVLNLDDEIEAASIVSKVNKKCLVGAYIDGYNRIKYTKNASKWFDMGLISKHGLTRANELKKVNKKSYQELIFQMLNLDFKGQQYVFPRPIKQENKEVDLKAIGLEERAGDRWKLKRWDKYNQLVSLLRNNGYHVEVFRQRENLLDYIEDINKCDLIITGDTLCMHVGIALQKQVIAIFGPTSADEIYDYGILHKITAPLDCIKCYKRECNYNPNCMQSIPLSAVYDKCIELINQG